MALVFCLTFLSFFSLCLSFFSFFLSLPSLSRSFSSFFSRSFSVFFSRSFSFFFSRSFDSFSNFLSRSFDSFSVFSLSRDFSRFSLLLDEVNLKVFDFLANFDGLLQINHIYYKCILSLHPKLTLATYFVSKSSSGELSPSNVAYPRSFLSFFSLRRPNNNNSFLLTFSWSASLTAIEHNIWRKCYTHSVSMHTIFQQLSHIVLTIVVIFLSICS